MGLVDTIIVSNKEMDEMLMKNMLTGIMNCDLCICPCQTHDICDINKCSEPDQIYEVSTLIHPELTSQMHNEASLGWNCDPSQPDYIIQQAVALINYELTCWDDKN